MNGSIITYSEYLQHFGDNISSDEDCWVGQYKTYGEMWQGENYFVITPISILEISKTLSDVSGMQIQAAFEEGKKEGIRLGQEEYWEESLGDEL